MFRLQIFLGKEQVKDVDLTSQHEWLVGRSSSCDIVLEGSPEISRQHLKIVYQGGVWSVEILSRFGNLFLDGQKISAIELRHGMRFEAPPFSFVFQDGESLERESQESAISEMALASQPDTGSGDVSDKTFVGQFSVVPYLRVVNERDQDVLLFRLDGSSWILGRDAACTLCIDNVKFSRRHLEIRIEEGAYMIRDLGSSNGTLLNGEAMISQEWEPFRSGDTVSVVDWKLHFELRDAGYEERLLGVSPELRVPMIVAEQPQPEGLYSHADLNAYANSGAPPPPTEKKKTNWVRMLIYLVLVGGALAYFAGGEEKPVEVAAGKKTGTAFDKLTSGQQQYVKDTYRLADRLFKEGRYEMARQEVAKIHLVLPEYEESKNMERLAGEAIQTQLHQQRLEAQEKEKLEMEDRIRQTVAQCKKKISSKIEMRVIDECLGSVIELNPDHPDILNLKSQVDQIIAQRIEDKERRAEYSALVRRQANLYEKALALDKAGKPLEALIAYAEVVQSKLPDPQGLKGRSKREIASIQDKLASQQTDLEKNSNEQFKSGNLKAAITTLKKAIEINPENETLKGRMNSMLGDLKKQMQVLYQEGVLEESVGEVETAKIKWKKIIELSLPEEDYYKKARSKIKKYEAE